MVYSHVQALQADFLRVHAEFSGCVQEGVQADILGVYRRAWACRSSSCLLACLGSFLALCMPQVLDNCPKLGCRAHCQGDAISMQRSGSLTASEAGAEPCMSQKSQQAAA